VLIAAHPASKPHKTALNGAATRTRPVREVFRAAADRPSRMGEEKKVASVNMGIILVQAKMLYEENTQGSKMSHCALRVVKDALSTP
jgi:hypothetical protein